MDVFAAIQSAIEIAGKLRDLSKKVEDADFKMLLVDLSDKLADAKLEVATLKADLAEAKMSLLTDLQGQLEKLSTENERLRTTLQMSQSEVGALNEQIRVLTERLTPTAASKLDQVQEDILLALAQHESLEESKLAWIVQVNKPVIAYHVEELRKLKFVHPVYAAGLYGETPRTVWSMCHSGREYLLRRGMLK